MKKRLFTTISAICLLICLLLPSCSKKPTSTKYSTYSMDYFDTVTTIIGYAESQEEFDRVAEEILTQLSEYHRLYTIYHRFDGLTNLCSLNELTDGEHPTLTVDKRIIDLLLYSKEAYELTDGVVNIAMGSVLSLWHNYRSIGKDNPAQASLPPIQKLTDASMHTDIENIIIDETNSTVHLADPAMTLDVGAVAKGYAAERIARSLEEKGITGYVLNVGGNIRTIGTKPDGTGWTVGIENPLGDEYLEYLELSGESVVTSGSYQRFYYVDGKAYHHIIDPDTLMPADRFLSVSVVCGDSGLGDVLSTALFCMPLEEGVELVESMSDTEAIWVDENGKKTVSSGWNKFVKNGG